ncbi:MAG: chemotaxis protein CheW [Proteobacteria bacterium SG_bin4]|nr:MAG: chemotaxis protein CheW [Proteobacteria bacterium SG_bin4]
MSKDYLQNLTNESPGHFAGATHNEFLTFRLGQEEYGIEILKVQEIRGYDAITQIANAPEFIKGVVNLRGIIVPIIDMRIKFNLRNVEYDQFTVVIILNLTNRVVGLVVDSVSDVITLAAQQIRPTPELGSSIDAEYIMGMGSLDARMLILVDIEKYLSNNGMNMIDSSVHQING